MSTPVTPPSGKVQAGTTDVEGVYRMRASHSAGVIGAYVILTLLIVLVVGRESTPISSWVTLVLLVATLLFLVRYLSVHYVIDDAHLIARTVFGRRRVPLEDVRAIEYASLRDLAPTGGLLASLVWRGKMYSPTVGEFELVYTEASSGLLVTAGAYPLYISPRRPVEFAKELSRRVRSYTGPLPKDVGFPPTA